MTSDSLGRSVFAGVDQERVLQAFDAATDDGLESTFFTPSGDPGSASSESRGIWTSDAEKRRTFILHGPGVFA